MPRKQSRANPIRLELSWTGTGGNKLACPGAERVGEMYSPSHLTISVKVTGTEGKTSHQPVMLVQHAGGIAQEKKTEAQKI
jgi:hypothetical protein